MTLPPVKLDSKGRCCGRKPIMYKREPHKFCPRCDRSFHAETGDQIENWAWKREGAGFRSVYRKPKS